MEFETKRRSVAKAISWRFFATLITASIVWTFTGRFDFAATVGLLDTGIKLLVYFFHERAWLKISYGRPRLPDYEI